MREYAEPAEALEAAGCANSRRGTSLSPRCESNTCGAGTRVGTSSDPCEPAFAGRRQALVMPPSVLAVGDCVVATAPRVAAVRRSSPHRELINRCDLRASPATRLRHPTGVSPRSSKVSASSSASWNSLRCSLPISDEPGGCVNATSGVRPESRGFGGLGRRRIRQAHHADREQQAKNGGEKGNG